MRGPPVSRWRLILHPPADGSTNMAVDEALLEACADGAPGFPCLRLYAFSPPCLSIGFSQERSGAVDEAFCRSRGIDVVRRPTGGRAVLHDDEITYAVVARREGAFAGTVLAAYRSVSRGLVSALGRLGLAAKLPGSGAPSAPRAGGAACFAEPSSHEIVVDGFKAAGSAQSRRRGTLLQHGSIPISMDAALLAAAVGEGGRRRGAGGPELPDVRGLSQILGRALPREALVEALRAGFEEAFGVALDDGALSPEEEARARRLRADRYADRGWSGRR